jgi:hypothetical protein
MTHKKHQNTWRKHFSLDCWLFYVTVVALIAICMVTDKWWNSEDRITIYASTGEQQEASGPTVSPSPSPVEVTPTVVRLTPTVSPAVTAVRTSGDIAHEPTAPAETVGAQARVQGGAQDELAVKRQICDVFKSDCDRAIQVAWAESGFRPDAKNGTSTATGVFQIIIGTWNLYKCEGERTNSVDNIKCAKKIYDRNHGKFNTGGGWAASFHAHQQD